MDMLNSGFLGTIDDVRGSPITEAFVLQICDFQNAKDLFKTWKLRGVQAIVIDVYAVEECEKSRQFAILLVKNSAR